MERDRLDEHEREREREREKVRGELYASRREGNIISMDTPDAKKDERE